MGHIHNSHASEAAISETHLHKIWLIRTFTRLCHLHNIIDAQDLWHQHNKLNSVLVADHYNKIKTNLLTK